jgi:hypothetical protein
MTRRALVAVMVASSLAAVAEAQEQRPRSPLRHVERAYEAGELEQALAALDAAEAGDGWTREDVLAALTYRLLVAHALGDEAALDRAALALASLDPEEPRRAVSPPIARAIERARARVGGRIRAVVRRAENGAARVLVVHDDAGIVRRLDVRARRAGGAWASGDDARAMLAEGGPGLELHARVFGPGGATLAALGSDERPVALEALELDAPPASGRQDSPPDDATDDTAIYVAAIAGGAVLAGILVAITVVALSTGGSGIGSIDIAW